MWYRPASAVGLLLSLGAVCSAQNPHTYSRAVPPDKAVLDRLNLRTEWSVYLPVEGGRDAIASIQTIDDQIFVQTRTGLLVTLDAKTGRALWSASLGSGGYSNVFPVAVNSRFVFVAHVTRLYAFYRYTGVTEFTMDMGNAPTAGLAADDTGVYAVLSIRAGSAGAQRLVAFDLPTPIVVADPTKVDPNKPVDPAAKAANPVDELTRRYPADGASRAGSREDDFGRTGRASSVREAPVGGLGGSRTPSLAITPRVSPPYSLDGAPTSPALNLLPTLRQPYHLKDETNRNIQRTPSIGTIPPSVAAALTLTDLRPRGVTPRVRWEFGLDSRVLFATTQSPLRLWFVTDAKALLALSKVDKKTEVTGPLWDQVAAAPGQAGTVAYVPLADGSIVAVDLAAGNQTGGLVSPWRVNAGGRMNRTPVVTPDAVFAAGDNSGVVRIDRATGAIGWRTDRAADRVAAVNKDFVYVRDRQGRLLVYDAVRATDPATGRAAPLATVDFSEFNVPVVNTVTDRLYLAADNGLLVCLRDASAKYAAPVRMAPELTTNPGSKVGVEGLNAPPPKDPLPKEPMPKDGMPPPKKAD